MESIQKGVLLEMDKEIELKDLKNLINNMKDTAIITVDLRALISDENVTESVTQKRGDNNGRD